MHENNHPDLNTQPAWLMLPSRVVLFLVFQVLFALVYCISGTADAWSSSADWWPISVTLTNVICIILLVKLFRSEGLSYKKLISFEKQFIKNDSIVLLGFLVIAAPIAYLPNILIARGLFGDEAIATNMIVGNLPLWAIWLSLFVLPITQGLAELPTYFAYIMPRLKAATNSTILAIILPSLFLAVQHLSAPLLFDSRFIVYRITMFLPFAFLVGILLYWRPRMLPYIMIIHVFMNISTVILMLTF